MKEAKIKMGKDPVCGMNVDEKTRAPLQCKKQGSSLNKALNTSARKTI